MPGVEKYLKDALVFCYTGSMANGDTTSDSTVAYPKRNSRRGLTLLLLIVIIIAIALFIWAEKQRRSVANQLEQTSAQLEEIRKSTNRNGQEVAKEVLGKVRHHMVIPDQPEPTVATIIDVDKLKQSSDFYAVAENGDNLIITEKRAILYDPDRDIILDVVPVRINKQSPSPTGSPNTRTTPSPTATSTASP